MTQSRPSQERIEEIRQIINNDRECCHWGHVADLLAENDALNEQLAQVTNQRHKAMNKKPRAMCYCGKCEMPFICCTQWDCPGVIEGCHEYECQFCENKKKAYRQKMKLKKDHNQKERDECPLEEWECKKLRHQLETQLKASLQREKIAIEALENIHANTNDIFMQTQMTIGLPLE